MKEFGIFGKIFTADSKKGMVMYTAFSHSHSAFIYSYYGREGQVKESNYTVQDAYMRSPAAAEDLKCHYNVLAVLPALQHLFQSAVLASDFNKYLCSLKL